MRKIVMSAALVPAVLALAACGGGQADTEADASTQEVAEEVAEVEAPVAPEEAAPADAAFADLTGDAAAGETAFAQCRACHMVDEGKNGVGPSLYGIIGREAGSIEGFRYSDANANSGVTWTPELMFEYLASPRDFMPGTRMAFPGLKDAQARADIIAYLEATDD